MTTWYYSFGNKIQNENWLLVSAWQTFFSSVSSCLNAVFPGLYFINFNMCKWQCKLHLRSSTSYANTCVIFNLFTIGFDILYIIFLAPYLNSFWCFLSVEYPFLFTAFIQRWSYVSRKDFQEPRVSNFYTHQTTC